MVVGVLPVDYLPPPGKGKGKIREIRYPSGSEYLRVAMRYADAVGPSRVKPSFAKIFATRYGPPSDVRIWCPFPRWSASLRRPLRTVFAFLCIPS